MEKEPNIPIWKKEFLTLEESSMYFGIGVNKLRELADSEAKKYVLWIGNKRLIKRRKFLEFLNDQYSI